MSPSTYPRLLNEREINLDILQATVFLRVFLTVALPFTLTNNKSKQFPGMSHIWFQLTTVAMPSEDQPHLTWWVGTETPAELVSAAQHHLR